VLCRIFLLAASLAARTSGASWPTWGPGSTMPISRSQTTIKAGSKDMVRLNPASHTRSLAHPLAATHTHTHTLHTQFLNLAPTALEQHFPIHTADTLSFITAGLTWLCARHIIIFRALSSLLALASNQIATPQARFHPRCDCAPASLGCDDDDICLAPTNSHNTHTLQH
jgi:hypothetical protein